MADNNGLQVLAGIVPKNQADTFATHFSKYGQGGHVEVANSAERDAITPERRTEGMKVYVQNEGNTYYLKGGIANSNWTNFLFMSSEINPVDALGNFGIDQRQFNIVPQVSSDNCSLYGLNFSFAVDPFDSNIQFGNGNSGGLTFINAFANHNANGNFGYARGINLGYSLGNGTSTGSMESLIGLVISNNIQNGYTLNSYTGIALFENFEVGSNLQFYNGIQISPNIRSTGLQYVAGLNLAMQLYSSIAGGYNVINTQGNFQSGASAQYFVEIQCGTNFQSGSSQSDYKTINVSPTFYSGSLVDNWIGVNISPNGPSEIQNSAVGLNIDMNNINPLVSGNRKVAMQVQGGVINLTTNIVSASNLFVDSGNLTISMLTIESGSPISNTEILLNNNASLVLALDDYAVGPIGLGIVKTLAGGQLSIASGKTVETTTNYMSGTSIPAQPGDGGTLTNHYDFKALGLFDGGGGNLNVVNYYAYAMAATASASFPPTNSWGLHIADPVAENFLKKSLVIGGTTGKVSNASVALQVADKKALLLTPMDETERDALTAIEGMIVAINPSGMGANCLNYYDGVSWKEIAFV